MKWFFARRLCENCRALGVGLGQRVPLGLVKAMSIEEARARFSAPADRLLGGEQIGLMGQLQQSITKLEKHILATTQEWATFQRVQDVPGIGKILGLTVALETGDPKRFASAGNFASYCRCVKSLRQSNSKKKGENNRKCGNRYLAWAFVEAAHLACRHDARCRGFYERKKQKTNPVVATKALACKLAKATRPTMHNGSLEEASHEHIGETSREPTKGSGHPSQ